MPHYAARCRTLRHLSRRVPHKFEPGAHSLREFVRRLSPTAINHKGPYRTHRSSSCGGLSPRYLPAMSRACTRFDAHAWAWWQQRRLGLTPNPVCRPNRLPSRPGVVFPRLEWGRMCGDNTVVSWLRSSETDSIRDVVFADTEVRWRGSRAEAQAQARAWHPEGGTEIVPVLLDLLVTSREVLVATDHEGLNQIQAERGLSCEYRGYRGNPDHRQRSRGPLSLGPRTDGYSYQRVARRRRRCVAGLATHAVLSGLSSKSQPEPEPQ